jgi:hypothetical protein
MKYVIVLWAVAILLALTVCVLGIPGSLYDGVGEGEVHTMDATVSTTPSPPPIILRDEPIGEELPVSNDERGEAGVEFDKELEPTPTPAPATGMMEDLSAAAHSYLAQNAVNLQYAVAEQALAARIDAYLAARGSPMQGTGLYAVRSARRYGHDPRLMPAIAEAESSCGLACFAPHNAWGMLAYPNGFVTWEAGIDAMNDWLYRYNGVCVSAPRNWCEPPDPWCANVTGVMESI